MSEMPSEFTAIGKEEITQEERDKLMHFNTKRFWHCWYDVKTDKLYNQFGTRIMDNAYNYLLGIVAINDKKEQQYYFEE